MNVQAKNKVSEVINYARNIVALDAELTRIKGLIEHNTRQIEVAVGSTREVAKTVTTKTAAPKKRVTKNNTAKLVQAMGIESAKLWTAADAKRVMPGATKATAAATLATLVKKGIATRAEEGKYQIKVVTQ